jgi:hypothetical protein
VISDQWSVSRLQSLGSWQPESIIELNPLPPAPLFPTPLTRVTDPTPISRGIR